MTDQAGDFGELATNLHNHSDVLGAVDGVLQFAVEVLHYDHASVLLMQRKHAQTVAATDELITSADQLQIDLGEGPSLQAIADHDDVLIEDTTTDTRWPKWAPTAAALTRSTSLFWSGPGGKVSRRYLAVFVTGSIPA